MVNLKLALLLGLLAGLGAAQPAAAAGSDRIRGVLAEHCVACHDVPGYESPRGRASVDAPSFQAMADAPEVYTEARLRRFLSRPHYPMQGFIFSKRDITDLIAFLRELESQ